jgi:hypothetical protein
MLGMRKWEKLCHGFESNPLRHAVTVFLRIRFILPENANLAPMMRDRR